ncbi:hypothetical protein AWB77_04310 [Caballeronia fortuita]|uniref:Uncharacterized protein n=1 Tax=Caballeronia fortuita TaxID=1777138 RepID=A0A158CN13_9BURK|nr:hypothetical protein AWB77_04310 [Caballeronia fortuita]
MNFPAPFFLPHHAFWSYVIPGAFILRKFSLVTPIRRATARRKNQQWRKRTAPLGRVSKPGAR